MKAENPNWTSFLEQTKALTPWEKSPLDYAGLLNRFTTPVFNGQQSPRAGIEQLARDLQAELDNAWAAARG